MKLTTKIDFTLIVTATNCNPNGDPLNGNRPRVNYHGLGEISDVCIKRKLRNRMQDYGNSIFVQSDDRSDDGFKSLSERASKSISTKDSEEFAMLACQKWLDVRSFGQVFAFKAGKEGVSVGVRGPVTVQQAISCSTIDINSMQITKSVNSEPGDKKSSDTMGTKHMVTFGVYRINGSINVQLADKTQFSDEDANVIKDCLKTLFVNDASSARPDGSMEVRRLFWWKHNCKDGQYSSATVHRSVHVEPVDADKIPMSFDDYIITVDKLEGLEPEIIDGI